MKPIVAVVGRPNVGKSTFFNRITRTRDALVDNLPGVTRDRIYGDVNWDETEFILVDTGGFIQGDRDPFAGPIRIQIQQAMADADAVVLLLDGKNGISPFDADLIGMVRALDKPVFYAVNKIDDAAKEDRLHDFYDLGIDHPYPVSAEHGYGISDFLDDLIRALPQPEIPAVSEDVIRVAVVGKPNAGKSSLINRILGQDRLVVSDLPGTTRDAVDSLCNIDGRTYSLVDTAGIRRKSKVSLKIEKFSIIKALHSLERCDVALVVIDAHEGITDQDVTIAGYAHERGCGCILLLNKWDLVEKEPGVSRKFTEAVRMETKFLNYAPILTISAMTGQRVPKIFKQVAAVYQQYASRIGTGQLNRILQKALLQNEPPLHKGKRLRFYYATQVSTKPPTFVCFVNYPEAVHFSYKRYLTNQIRNQAGLTETPLRILFRQRTGRIEFGNWKKEKKKKRR